MNEDFWLRIKDVTLCLSAADNYDILLGRLEMQKIIYLYDSMCAYLFILSGKKAHQTYFYGPYDKNIQNAVDALVIRELVNINNFSVSSNKSISCDYSLTSEGRNWARKILENSNSIQHRSQIADGILYSLIQRDLLGKVKDLVYAEPMFVEAKGHGYYYDLNFTYKNPGYSYLTLIDHYLKGDKKSINIRFTIDMYIDYLQARSEMLSSKITTGGD